MSLQPKWGRFVRKARCGDFKSDQHFGLNFVATNTGIAKERYCQVNTWSNCFVMLGHDIIPDGILTEGIFRTKQQDVTVYQGL